MEGEKQHSRSSLSLAVSSLKLEREGRRRGEKRGICGMNRQQKNKKSACGWREEGAEEHKPGERKQERHRRKWASGGYLRVTGCCHDCTVLWVNCQNIDWSTWQPSPSSFFSKFYSWSFFFFFLLLPQKIKLPTLECQTRQK